MASSSPSSSSAVKRLSKLSNHLCPTNSNPLVKVSAQVSQALSTGLPVVALESTIISHGYFCPALAKAVKTMKKGEKVLLTVKPQYGFGEDGRPATGGECAVPPNATLHITLELVSWKSVFDITKDKKVLKKIVKEGEGYERPNDGTMVQLKLIGKLSDGKIFIKKGYDEEPFEFKIDEEEQVIDGLDKAVKTMKKGENVLITIQPEYAFGSSESNQELAVVPANSTVYYEVEMVSFVKEMDTPQKIEAAGKKKEEGNALFKAGKFERASKRYEKAVSFIEYDSSFNDEEKKQAKLLKLDSGNVKALYRRAQAYIQLVDLDLAEADIKKALEIDPDNRDVKLEYRVLKEKIKGYNKRDAQFYGNIFAKMNKSAGKQEATPMAIDSKA
ncbi:peptidyl-prolyl cis-trans isomerase FKBP62-like [Gossypium australe]|uniref:peptidylprolyl isomerase n=1 Tax=Gossypium australe TaxID=47621 RepID=A0A5B6VBJ2_9ROSI|nr:peptidyl-prolyl cis-trans isomerase FKBP62-like [Gossypium australe]